MLLAPSSLPEFSVLVLSELVPLLVDGLEPCASLLLDAEVPLEAEDCLSLDDSWPLEDGSLALVLSLSLDLLVSDLSEELLWSLELLLAPDVLDGLLPLEALEEDCWLELLAVLLSLPAAPPSDGSFNLGQLFLAKPGALFSCSLVMFSTRWLCPG